MVTPGVGPRPPRGLRWVAVGQVLLWSAIGLGAFLLLAKSVQNSAEFGRMQLWILLVDICGVVALSVLLARQLWRLVRDYRAHVPGSRLTARTVGIFGALVIAPLLIVYMFSLEFINQGIDSWFKVEVKQGLNDALGLSRAAIDLRMREYVAAHGGTRRDARRHSTPRELPALLNSERRISQALEITLFGRHGRIIAASLENALETLPSQPPPDLLRQVEQQRPYVEPRAAVRGPLPDPHRRRAPARRGARRAALRGRDLPGAGAARGAVGGRAGLLQRVRQSRRHARAAQVQLPPDADAGACCSPCWPPCTWRSTRRSAWCARCRT